MIAIIDYKAGNLTSVSLAFQSIGRESMITSKPADILAAERVVFPGVGAAAAAMRNLIELNLVDAIRNTAQSGKPMLGICLGTQIIMQHSDENDGVDCLNLIPGQVRRFQPQNPRDKVPQMGWNSVRQSRTHPLFHRISDASEFYFVHSFYPAPANEAVVLGTTDYAGISFASVLTLGSLVATQFHPEKSGRIGLQLLENFCRWNPD